MTILRAVAVATFVAGLTLLAAGFLYSRDSEAPAVAPPLQSLAATATPTPSTTPVSPTPTPVPYDGAVARLRIPRFGVDSAIETIGVDANNEMQTPHDPHNTGWYDVPDWGKPGFGKNAVFSAHVDYYPDILGPFNKLSKTDLNDEIVVVMDSGLEYHYRVVRVEQFLASEIKMGELIWPQEKPADREWITLITCGGTFVASRPGGPGSYLSRDVVVAERYQ